VEDAVRHTDLVFVCVGTPSQANGGIDLRYIKRVCEQIGRTLAYHPGAPVIVFRSTLLPGTMRGIVLPLLGPHSGTRAAGALDVDAHRVMEIFYQDQKLNLSPYYLKPGFAFGGSCLPKDLRALLYKAKTLDVQLPILASVLPSNQLQIERGVQAVVEKGNKKVGIIGFSFKDGTDGMRESPMVELTERLIGKGYDLRIYDRSLSLACLHGANRDYILNKIPHISR